MPKKMLHPHRKFDDEILNSSIADRVEFFTGQLVRHKVLDQAYQELMLKACNVGGVEFIQLAGPTGAGKSTVIERFTRDKLAEFEQLISQNPHDIPVIKTVCPAAVKRKVPWQSLLKNILKSGGHALADSGQFILEYPEGTSQKNISKVLMRDNDEQELFDLVSNYINARNVCYLIIDEAQHIIDACKSGTEAFSAMEVLKSLAANSGCIIVLCGTYRLLRFGDSSAQLGRRSEIVELGPYQRGSDEELIQFGDALDALLARYPIHFSSTIFEKVSEIHLACCGCIGILKDLLTKALHRTLVAGKSHVSYSSLMENSMHPRELRRVAKEIEMGKDYFSRVAMIEVEEILLGAKTSVKKKAAKGPVQRKPERDPVEPM